MTTAAEWAKQWLDKWVGTEGSGTTKALIEMLDAYARQQVEACRERAAQVVDQWACSVTCDPTGGPCEHIRVAVTIAAAIRGEDRYARP
mgnify:CR=1 FL=1